MKITQALLTAAIMLTVTGTPHAALVPSLGGQVVNDTDLNVTWLANANLAATNTFGVSGVNANGSMNWYTANNWIASMNAANYLGYHDWRLPTTLQPDPSCSSQPSPSVSQGGNCTGSEMGHLFYNELGGTYSYSQTVLNSGSPNLALFSNIQAPIGIAVAYWSGTKYPDSTAAWSFFFNFGAQGPDSTNNMYYALAVRSGQVATVPVPAAVWLFGSGLISLAGVARKRKTA